MSRCRLLFLGCFEIMQMGASRRRDVAWGMEVGSVARLLSLFQPSFFGDRFDIPFSEDGALKKGVLLDDSAGRLREESAASSGQILCEL